MSTTSPADAGNYLLWMTERQGWLASVGTSTDIKQALRFSRATATDLAKKHLDHNGNFGAVPTHLGLLEEVLKP